MRDPMPFDGNKAENKAGATKMAGKMGAKKAFASAARRKKAKKA
jgi:hypothetical protein